MAMVTGTAAALYILGNKTRNAQVRRRMLELWKDRSKPPGPQWSNVKRTMADWDLSAAALNEANRIWALHQADLNKSGTTRNSGKTFFKGQDEIYISKNKEVKLSKKGEYIPQGNYVTLKRSSYSAIPGLTDGKGDYMTAKEFKTTFPTSFKDKPTTVPKVSYKNVKVTGAPVKLDDGSFVVLDRDGKNTPILPGTAFYSAAEKAYKSGQAFQLTGGKGEPVSEPVKAENSNLPETVNDYKGPSSPSSRRHHGTKSLNIKPNDKVVVRNPETNVEQTYTSPHPQVGRLKINPGGLVGRYDDIRMDNKGSTSLSIAQADWGSYKKGDQLSVMTRSDRRAYDKQVLNV